MRRMRYKEKLDHLANLSDVENEIFWEWRNRKMCLFAEYKKNPTKQNDQNTRKDKLLKMLWSQLLSVRAVQAHLETCKCNIIPAKEKEKNLYQDIYNSRTNKTRQIIEQHKRSYGEQPISLRKEWTK